MNAYQESLLYTQQAERSQEIRALQLSGQSGSELESESELYRYATVRRAPAWIRALATMIARWGRDRLALAPARRRKGSVRPAVARTVAEGLGGRTNRKPAQAPSGVGTADRPAVLVPRSADDMK